MEGMWWLLEGMQVFVRCTRCSLLRLVRSWRRRLEEELKLYCGDVLQTSLVEILTEKLHKEAKSEMGERQAHSVLHHCDPDGKWAVSVFAARLVSAHCLRPRLP